MAPQIIILPPSPLPSFLLSLQSHQERAYQEYCASKAIEKAQEQESYYEQALAVHTSEIACIPTHHKKE